MSIMDTVCLLITHLVHDGIHNVTVVNVVLLERDRICRARYAIARPSVCP